MKVKQGRKVRGGKDIKGGVARQAVNQVSLAGEEIAGLAVNFWFMVLYP